MTESSDAGASRASKIVRLASDIDFNEYIDISGTPCLVIEHYTKRGLCHFKTMDILTGYLVWSIVPPSKEFVIPDVSREIYQSIGISYKDHYITLLHQNGTDTRFDIFLPEDRNLRTMMVDGFEDDKRVIVGIVTSLGKDAVYAVDVLNQSGSAIRFKPTDNVLDESKTIYDSDYVPRNVGFYG